MQQFSSIFTGFRPDFSGHSSFLCNVYKLLCKTLCLLSITKDGLFVYTSTISAYGGIAPTGANPTHRESSNIKGEMRYEYAKKYGWNLIVESNMEAFHAGVGPFTHGSKVHTDLMKTQALLRALDKYKFDAAFGGARRDEEKSRAKERIFSFRDKFHQWDPKNQRPELWDIYNARVHKGESIRVFPLSNWTELDIWQYIRLENIPIVPLYYAKERPVVQMDGNLIMADDERLPEKYRDQIEMKMVRFRTLGCWPLTGAVESEADTIEKIVEEMMTTTKSERTTRVIDFDQDASMEQKKREGYF